MKKVFNLKIIGIVCMILILGGIGWKLMFPVEGENIAANSMPLPEENRIQESLQKKDIKGMIEKIEGNILWIREEEGTTRKGRNFFYYTTYQW